MLKSAVVTCKLYSVLTAYIITLYFIDVIILRFANSLLTDAMENQTAASRPSSSSSLASRTCTRPAERKAYTAASHTVGKASVHKAACLIRRFVINLRIFRAASIVRIGGRYELIELRRFLSSIDHHRRGQQFAAPRVADLISTCRRQAKLRPPRRSDTTPDGPCCVRPPRQHNSDVNDAQPTRAGAAVGLGLYESLLRVNKKSFDPSRRHFLSFQCGVYAPTFLSGFSLIIDDFHLSIH